MVQYTLWSKSYWCTIMICTNSKTVKTAWYHKNLLKVLGINQNFIKEDIDSIFVLPGTTNEVGSNLTFFLINSCNE